MTLLEARGHHVAGDPRPYFDALHGLEAAREFVEFGGLDTTLAACTGGGPFCGASAASLRVQEARIIAASGVSSARASEALADLGTGDLPSGCVLIIRVGAVLHMDPAGRESGPLRKGVLYPFGDSVQPGDGSSRVNIAS
jgi:hypothetical protein